jgi:2-polyprenyl-6-methoxyphenol hydroxylase-like FAD-dependent oxidoreductase
MGDTVPDIGILGAGISGLHLALRLQQRGVASTLYAERTPEELAAGPPANLAVRFEHTRARERELGVAPWDAPEHGMSGANFAAPGDPPLGFRGRLKRPGSAVDFRVYLPRLMSDYAERGGVIEYLAPDAESINRLAPRHDLVVVASGRRSVAELFPRDPGRSPYAEPQRMITAGLFHGIARDPRDGLHFQLCPEVGEIFSIRLLTRDGPLAGINIEAIPGGPLEYLSQLSPADGLGRAVLKELAEHAPALRERADEREFDLAGPNDLLQGAITPTVRTGWAVLTEGKYCVAVGDAWVVNDPVTGQGANLGSHSAFVLAEEILAGPPYDEAFCRKAEARMWEFARPVTEWTNAFLQPPPPHALAVLGAASQDQRVADAFVNNFNDPVAQWAALGTPEGAAAWLAGFARKEADA